MKKIVFTGVLLMFAFYLKAPLTAENGVDTSKMNDILKSTGDVSPPELKPQATPEIPDAPSGPREKAAPETPGTFSNDPTLWETPSFSSDKPRVPSVYIPGISPERSAPMVPSGSLGLGPGQPEASPPVHFPRIDITKFGSEPEPEKKSGSDNVPAGMEPEQR